MDSYTEARIETANKILSYIYSGNDAAFREPYRSIDDGKYTSWKSAAYLDVASYIENEILDQR